MRWSILASTGHPKHAAALVKSWLVKVGFITEETEFTNESSQVDEKEHGVDMVKELVRHQEEKFEDSDLMNIQGFCRVLQLILVGGTGAGCLGRHGKTLPNTSTLWNSAP